MHEFLKTVLKNMPNDWLRLTTHRLDIYDEALAKTQFLEAFEALYQNNDATASNLKALPTAFDYIRLGHPLSCVLEWGIAKLNGVTADQVISFSSRTIPMMAVLRKNQLDNKNTRILYTEKLPPMFDVDTLRKVYGYQFELTKIETGATISAFDGSTIYSSETDAIHAIETFENVDFTITSNAALGSIIVIHDMKDETYIPAIQHVRRRETIAMTPSNCLSALQHLVGVPSTEDQFKVEKNKAAVLDAIQKITASPTDALLASSGLSIQYAIMMGLIDEAMKKHPGKPIKIIVPPNCYGGTNDQARRVAASIGAVEIVDLPVDGDNDMVQSIDRVLTTVAAEDAIPYIIAEIPTNPRVEVPNLQQLKAVLSTKRRTGEGNTAIDPVFILDQTFCPNVQFLASDGILNSVRAISYVSGSKFPSGGKCTAGYCVANAAGAGLMPKIKKHLQLCDNEATHLQVQILAAQLPSMNQRIKEAYSNTREFVNFIKENLPEAKINFVSETLAAEGFTPSVFSLDLPTKGDTDEERETYKRALNLKLIDMMITEIPSESKYCVSYGQLKGCYWTIPATSTQGTTKEGDKDYIARVSVSPDLDLERHKSVFLQFLKEI